MIGFASHEAWSDPVAHLSLANAIAVLNEPVGILLENRTNDWAFLQKIMRKEDREWLNRAVQERWTEPLHGGGSDLERNLKARLSVAAQALRTFVVFDSDRLHPDEWADDWPSNRIGTNPVSCRAFEWERLTKANMPQRYWGKWIGTPISRLLSSKKYIPVAAQAAILAFLPVPSPTSEPRPFSHIVAANESRQTPIRIKRQASVWPSPWRHNRPRKILVPLRVQLV